MFVIWCGLVHTQACTTPFEWRMNMKIGRNDPCPCGSGKKYKHCHWGKPLPVKKDQAVQAKRWLHRISVPPSVILAFGVLVSIGVGFWKGTYTALIVAAAWALGSAAYLSSETRHPSTRMLAIRRPSISEPIRKPRNNRPASRQISA